MAVCWSLLSCKGLSGRGLGNNSCVQIAPELSRMRVYVLKFKGLSWSLGFGTMVEEAGTSWIFQIQIHVSATDAESGFHTSMYLC